MSLNVWKLIRPIALFLVAVLSVGVGRSRGQEVGLESVQRRLDALESQVGQLSMAPHVVFGADDDGSSACHCQTNCECEELCCPGWEAAAEMVYFKPRQRGLDYAVSEDGTTAVFGNATIHNLDYDRNAGARASVGYRTKTGWAVRGGYTSFETDGIAGADRPTGIGQLFPTRSQPDGFVETDSARARSQFEYHTFDLTGDRPVYQNSFSLLSIFGGVRWVDLDELHRFTYNGRDFTNGRVIDQNKMSGVGLRMGSEGRWQMAKGISVFGSLAGGLTYGRFTSTTFEDNLDSAIVVTDVTNRFEQAVANLEARGGVSASWRNVLVSAGYELNNWFGVIDRTVFTGNVERGGLATISDDLLLEGLFVRVAMNW